MHRTSSFRDFPWRIPQPRPHTSPDPSQPRSFALSWLNRHPENLVTEPYGRAIDDTAGELPTRGVDIVATGASHGRQHAALNQLVPEPLDHSQRRALVMRPREGIERNQIDLGWMVFQQPGQLPGLGGRVVDPVQHDVFESNTAAVLFIEVVPTGLEQLRD